MLFSEMLRFCLSRSSSQCAPSWGQGITTFHISNFPLHPELETEENCHGVTKLFLCVLAEVYVRVFSFVIEQHFLLLYGLLVLISLENSLVVR